MAIFHDGPKAAHGVRLLRKDVTRQGLQITLEGYSDDNGWSAGTQESNKKNREEDLVDFSK